MTMRTVIVNVGLNSTWGWTGSESPHPKSRCAFSSKCRDVLAQILSLPQPALEKMMICVQTRGIAKISGFTSRICKNL